MILPNLEQINNVLDGVKKVAEEHGGNITVLDIIRDDSNFNVKLQLEGACSSCAISEFTIRYGVERALKENFTNFSKVILVS